MQAKDAKGLGRMAFYAGRRLGKNCSTEGIWDQICTYTETDYPRPTPMNDDPLRLLTFGCLLRYCAYRGWIQGTLLLIASWSPSSARAQGTGADLSLLITAVPNSVAI